MTKRFRCLAISAGLRVKENSCEGAGLRRMATFEMAGSLTRRSFLGMPAVTGPSVVGFMKC